MQKISEVMLARCATSVNHSHFFNRKPKKIKTKFHASMHNEHALNGGEAEEEEDLNACL